MELGQYQLQIFVSLVVVLGAAFVALICDFLKGNNEQLRELAIELKVRREEEQRRPQTMLPQRVERSRRAEPVPQHAEHAQAAAPLAPLIRPTAPPSALHAAAYAAKHPPLPKRSEAKPAPPAPALKEKPAPAASSAVASVVPSVVTSVVTNVVTKPAVTKQSIPMQSVAKSVAAKSVPTRPVAVKTVAATSPARKVATTSAAPKLVPTSAAPKLAASSAAPKKDWGSLIARSNPKQTVEIQKDLMDAVVAATTSQREVSIPTGFQQSHVLHGLVESRQPISGLVVSIGVTAPHAANGAIPAGIVELIQSLIGPGEFACRSNDEEFLLVCPGERGASAQRRLSQISQQLWDFQLRSLDKFSVLFSWGGIEVRSEPIDEAIESAQDRMHETRRGRKLLMMESRPEMAFRQAV